MRIKNPEYVREKLREYYREADLWLPERRDGEVDGHRVFRFRVLREDGRTHFYRIRDNIYNKDILREHLVKETPIDAYFMVSSFLNPSITGPKTWNKEDIDDDEEVSNNSFMWSDFAVDCDHRNTEEVEKIYNFLSSRGIPEKHMYIVFSGNGWHIKVRQWFRDKTISDPIEKEKAAHKAMHQLAYMLIDKGFDFDYQIQGDKVNSPSSDTRRVTKLPQTVTKYGNKAEVVDINDIHGFEPTMVIPDVEIESKKVSYGERQKRESRVIDLG